MERSHFVPLSTRTVRNSQRFANMRRMRALAKRWILWFSYRMSGNSSVSQNSSKEICTAELENWEYTHTPCTAGLLSLSFSLSLCVKMEVSRIGNLSLFEHRMKCCERISWFPVCRLILAWKSIYNIQPYKHSDSSVVVVAAFNDNLFVSHTKSVATILCDTSRKLLLTAIFHLQWNWSRHKHTHNVIFIFSTARAHIALSVKVHCSAMKLCEKF